MPSLANHQSNQFTKLLLIGDAKSGKTGSLVSLVKAGYKLRILDFDNLLDILKFKVMEECPDKLDNVEFVTVRDAYKAGASGSQIDGKPKKHGSVRLSCSIIGSTTTLILEDPQTGDQIVSLSLTVFPACATLLTTFMKASSPEANLEITMGAQFTETLRTMLKKSWPCSPAEVSPPTSS